MNVFFSFLEQLNKLLIIVGIHQCSEIFSDFMQVYIMNCVTSKCEMIFLIFIKHKYMAPSEVPPSETLEVLTATALSISTHVSSSSCFALKCCPS